LNGGLTYKQLDEWKRKAALLDEAVEYMTGRLDNEKLMRVYAILTRRQSAKK
jgi:hypothetical protein